MWARVTAASEHTQDGNEAQNQRIRSSRTAIVVGERPLSTRMYSVKGRSSAANFSGRTAAGANAPMLRSHAFPQRRKSLVVFADGARAVDFSRMRRRSVRLSRLDDMLPPSR